MKRLEGIALVVSDIHGNLAALNAVLEMPHDHVICLGDVIGRGPQPLECVARLREEDLLMILGNHEFGLLQSVTALSNASAETVDFLNGLPRWLRVDLDVGSCLCVHGSPRSPFGRGIGPDIASWRGHLATSVPVDVILAGHTHIPYDISVDGTRVVNPGSVGLPQDSDPRAAYAVIRDGTLELKRVEYRIEKTIAAIDGASMGLTQNDTRSLISWLRNGIRDSHRRPDPAGTP